MSLAIPPGTDLSKVPALAPPHGVCPNFIEPASRASGLRQYLAIVTAITLAFVMLRMYTKLFVTKAIGWDDGKQIQTA